MQIDLDVFFNQTTLMKQKKLLEYVFRETWRNEESIRALGTFLSRRKAETKKDWSAASKQYQNDYVCTQFRYDLSTRQKQTVEAANRKMLNEVKRCKSKYDRWVKIIDHYEKLKIKNTN